jgi:hypothetical protein
MPNPTQSDLHVNVPLTSVSVAYLQAAEDYIATKVFPKVPVQKQSDLYWKYSKIDWRRTDVERRAPSTESTGVGWNVNTDSYFAHVYAVHKDIDDQLRANADSNFNLDSDSTKFITNQLLLKRDIDWCDSFFKTGVWTTEYSGVASSPTSSQFVQWNNAGSDPINDVAKWVIGFRQLTGYAPNIMVLGANVMQELKNHPDIIDRIKYTQRGIVTEDLIAMLFGVPKIVVAYATSTDPATTQPYNYANTTQDNTVANFKFIANSKAAALYYTPDSPSLMTPSAGYSFTWNGYSAGNSEGIKIKSFRMEHIASDRIEAEMTYDMKVVAADMGIYLADAVA